MKEDQSERKRLGNTTLDGVSQSNRELLCDDTHAGACLGKNAQANDQFMVHLAIVLDWKTEVAPEVTATRVCQQTALLWYILSWRERGVKYHLGGYSGPLLFKIRGWATRAKRELYYLFRSCDAPSAILCFSPSDLLGRCQNSLFCDLMFLCSQFTIIIWLNAFFTRVHALYGLYGLLFCISRFLSVSQLIHPLHKINERKEGRKVSKKKGRRFYTFTGGRISFLSMKTQLMRAYLGKITGLLNNAA